MTGDEKSDIMDGLRAYRREVPTDRNTPSPETLNRTHPDKILLNDLWHVDDLLLF